MQVLIATEPGIPMPHTLAEARRLLRLERAAIAVVAVVPLGALAVDGLAPAGGAALLATETELARAAADAAVATLAGWGLPATAHVVAGDPAAEIVDLAGTLRADVVVVASHGKGGFERLLMGSVSDAVVHHWRGAVLVVHPPA